MYFEWNSNTLVLFTRRQHYYANGVRRDASFGFLQNGRLYDNVIIHSSFISLLQQMSKRIRRYIWLKHITIMLL